MSNTDRIKGSEIHWEELYILSDHWKSDLEFYKDDLRFLHHLIDKYIIWITKDENLKLVEDIKNHLLELKTEGSNLLKKVLEHRNEIGHVIDHSSAIKESYTKKEHLELEKAISQYVKDFRDNRKSVFQITEYIMDSEELPNVLKS